MMDSITKYAESNGFVVGACCASVLTPPDGVKLPWDFEAKTVIVIGVGYGKREVFALDDKPRGRLALYTVGEDYHTTVRAKLEGLRDFLYEIGFAFESYIQVDSGPLPERKLALVAGLGWIGKNGCMFSEKYGSFFNIGCMVVSAETNGEIDCAPGVSYLTEAGCRSCEKCVKACPTNVFADNDYSRCISAITQKKGKLSEWEQEVMGEHLFGCDICQAVCPLNIGKHVGEIADIDEVLPSVEEILVMDEAEYNRRYGNTAMNWRGLKVLQRNAEVVYRNLQKGEN